MAFNLNTSRKPEVNLYRSIIHETISIYGLPVKYIYSEKVNKNPVFNDFSHMKVNELDEDDYKEVYLLPEDSSDWEGDTVYNNFGFYNQWTQHLFISRESVLELYPDFDKGRSVMVNSLIITPGNSVLEITNIETYEPGINNLWGFADENSVYKLSVKIYNHNIADEGITDIQTDIDLSEGPDGEIFDYTENIDTSFVDNFFEEIENKIDTVEELGDKGDDKGKKPSNTNSPFGNLS